MHSMEILKASERAVSRMNPELETKRMAREPAKEEESSDSRAKASLYALLNRPSPPF